MAATLLDGGTTATQDIKHLPFTGGTITSDTTSPRAGTRTNKGATGSPANYFYSSWTGVLQDAGSRITKQYRLDTMPASGNPSIMEFESGVGNTCFTLTISATGKLRFYSNGVLIGIAGTTTLVGGGFYRISVAYTITSTTVNRLKCWIDGVLELDVTNATLAFTGTNVLYIGFIGSAAEIRTNNFAYWCDVYVDDSNALTDVGNVRVTSKKAAAVVTAGFLGADLGTGAVNERPLSITNAKVSTATGTQDQTYDIETAAVGDEDISTATLLATRAWIYAKCSATTDNANLWNRNAVTVAITLTTTPSMYYTLTTSASYPTASQSNIGLRSTAKIDTLYEAGMLVAYIPAAGGASFVQRRALMGVGK